MAVSMGGTGFQPWVATVASAQLSAVGARARAVPARVEHSCPPSCSSQANHVVALSQGEPSVPEGGGLVEGLQIGDVQVAAALLQLQAEVGVEQGNWRGEDDPTGPCWTGSRWRSVVRALPPPLGGPAVPPPPPPQPAHPPPHLARGHQPALLIIHYPCDRLHPPRLPKALLQAGRAW